MTQLSWQQLRRWWRKVADVLELEAVPWWVPVTLGGNPERAEPPTVSWQVRGAAPMLRLGPESRLWSATDAPGEAESLRLITIAPVPVGARLEVDHATWQVREARRRGPQGACRLLVCEVAEAVP